MLHNGWQPNYLYCTGVVGWQYYPWDVIVKCTYHVDSVFELSLETLTRATQVVIWDIQSWTGWVNVNKHWITLFTSNCGLCRKCRHVGVYVWWLRQVVVRDINKDGVDDVTKLVITSNLLLCCKFLTEADCLEECYKNDHLDNTCLFHIISYTAKVEWTQNKINSQQETEGGIYWRHQYKSRSLSATERSETRQILLAEKQGWYNEAQFSEAG